MMKIIYLSTTFFADCDFPLIHELQNKGHEVIYYLPLASFNLKSTLFNFKKLYPRTGIYPSSIYEEFKVFENEIDLSKCHIVNQVHKQKFHPLNLILMAWLALKILFSDADIIHLTSAPRLSLKLLYLKKKKLVYTVHDPFTHTGESSFLDEIARKTAFRRISRLLLLNNAQKQSFAESYKVPESHIFVSRLGSYDTITRVEPLKTEVKKPYILFFGRIGWYKGLDILLEAMTEVKNKCPDLTLVVAGTGELWFDETPYENLGNIDFRMRFIGIQELAGLLSGCEFVVCPYREATQSGVVQTSLSMKTPAIVTDVGALPEAVGYGRFGCVVRQGVVSEMAQAIIDLHMNTGKQSEMRNAISKEWLPSMAWSTIAEDYLRCYSCSCDILDKPLEK